ncbi:MAG: hypothetical protein M1819_001460 [Sarea resinae]|nr:MAG: hypothetical protein M1819_001460 [Sarea resinae]
MAAPPIAPPTCVAPPVNGWTELVAVLLPAVDAVWDATLEGADVVAGAVGELAEEEEEEEEEEEALVDVSEGVLDEGMLDAGVDEGIDEAGVDDGVLLVLAAVEVADVGAGVEMESGSPTDEQVCSTTEMTAVFNEYEFR